MREIRHRTYRIHRSVKLTLLLAVASASAASASYTTRQVVLGTDQVPGGGATFGALSAPSINARGAIVWSDQAAIYTNAAGAWRGPLRIVLRVGDVVPGVLGPLAQFGGMSLTNDGSTAFRGDGPYVDGEDDRGIYVLLPSGG